MNQQEPQLHEDTELITIVNLQNDIIGSMTRSQMRKEKQIFRGTFIFVIQKESKKLFCHKRTSLKKYCPSYYDVCFGGVVGVGESYESCAVRELQEESGLENQQLHQVSDFYHDGAEIRVWGRIFYTIYDGSVDNIKPQPEEVEFVELISVIEIQDRLKNGEQFTPIGIQAFNILIEYFQNNSLI